MNRRLTRIGNRIGLWLYRHTDGRLAGGADQVLMLTSPGRKSGVPRPACMQYLTVPEGFMVWGTGSGSPSDPDWFRNLRATSAAQVQVGARHLTVQPRELIGAERDSAWNDVILARQPRVAKYARKAGRTIPVAILTPMTDAGG